MSSPWPADDPRPNPLEYDSPHQFNEAYIQWVKRGEAMDDSCMRWRNWKVFRPNKEWEEAQKEFKSFEAAMKHLMFDFETAMRNRMWKGKYKVNGFSPRVSMKMIRKRAAELLQEEVIRWRG